MQRQHVLVAMTQEFHAPGYGLVQSFICVEIVESTTPLYTSQIGAEPMRAWVSGQVIAFDDSFEHEVMEQDLFISLVRFSILNVHYTYMGYEVAPHPTCHRLFLSSGAALLRPFSVRQPATSGATACGVPGAEDSEVRLYDVVGSLRMYDAKD